MSSKKQQEIEREIPQNYEDILQYQKMIVALTNWCKPVMISNFYEEILPTQ